VKIIKWYQLSTSQRHDRITKPHEEICQAFEYFLIDFYYLLVEHFCSDNENKNDGKHMTSTFNNVFSKI